MTHERSTTAHHATHGAKGVGVSFYWQIKIAPHSTLRQDITVQSMTDLAKPTIHNTHLFREADGLVEGGLVSHKGKEVDK